MKGPKNANFGPRHTAGGSKSGNVVGEITFLRTGTRDWSVRTKLVTARPSEGTMGNQTGHNLSTTTACNKEVASVIVSTPVTTSVLVGTGNGLGELLGGRPV